MKVENDPIALSPRHWLHWADMDWVAARVLYLEKNPRLWPPAGHLAHKALEFYLKTHLRSHGSNERWGGPQGHNLVDLARSCQEFDDYFKDNTILQRFQLFLQLYEDWRYPQTVPAVDPDRKPPERTPDPDTARAETSLMGGENLVLLDEIVADIRPRINFPALETRTDRVVITCPSQFTQFHADLVDGRALVRLASKENPTFDRMEAEAKKRHPPPQVILKSKG